MDEIFGSSNFIGSIVWKKKTNGNGVGHIPPVHDYIVCYARNEKNLYLPGLKLSEKYIEESFKNPDNDPKGPWGTMDLSANHKGPHFPITNIQNGKVYSPPKGRYWVFNEDEVKKRILEGRIIFGKKGNSAPIQKVYLLEKNQAKKAETWWDKVALNSDGMKELFDIFGEKIFDHPKPSELIRTIVQFSTEKNDIVLDSFGGSGSTAHGVLKQNIEDNGDRKFILVELLKSTAENITRKRVATAINGYTNIKDKVIASLGGGFQFCKLSEEPLFTAEGQIRSDVKFAQLAEFVWFAETGTGFSCDADSPLLGIHEGRAIYLLYNGILKDRSIAGGNVLTGPVYEILPKHTGPKVIYAAANRMGNRIAKENIVFKQTPYALEV